MSAEEKNDPPRQRRNRIGRKSDGSMSFTTRGPAIPATITGKEGRAYREGYSAPRRSRDLEVEEVQAIDVSVLADNVVTAAGRLQRADDEQVRVVSQRLLKKRMGLMMALANR